MEFRLSPSDSIFIKTASNTFLNLYRDYKENEELPPPWMSDEYTKQFNTAKELKRKLQKD